MITSSNFILSRIPNEIQQQVYDLLSIVDIANLRELNKASQKSVDNDAVLWKSRSVKRNIQNLPEGKQTFQLYLIQIFFEKNKFKTTLDIRNIKLTEIPSDIKKLSFVKWISFYAIPLHSFPSHVLDLKQLNRLSISNSEIKSIPDKISELSNLYSLNLSYNKIKDISENIKDLTILENLNLSHNQIDQFPDVITTLNIKVLTLSFNQLSSLPLHSITSGNIASSLTSLFLDNNDFEPNAISSKVEKLAKLENLVELTVGKGDRPVNSIPR